MKIESNFSTIFWIKIKYLLGLLELYKLYWKVRYELLKFIHEWNKIQTKGKLGNFGLWTNHKEHVSYQKKILLYIAIITKKNYNHRKIFEVIEILIC